MTFTVSYGAYLPNAIDLENAGFQLIENQTATVCLFGRFYFLGLSASIRSPKQIQLSWFLRFLTDFRFADCRMIGISAFPVFLFPCFCISGLCVNLHSTL